MTSEFVFSELDAPNTCGTCACGAPSGSCPLSTTVSVASANCSGSTAPDVTHMSFNAPAAWDGSCTADNAIPANLKCNGVDCVQSLSLTPLTLTETPCAVSVEPAPSKVPYTWGAVARTCRGSAVGPCASPVEGCVPPAPPGFEQCLLQSGVKECPSTYPVRHLFYYGLEDTRDCTPCACSAPIGSNCAALVSVFKDSACTSPVLVMGVDTIVPSCGDLPDGTALGSKRATAPVYLPGACQVSGGEPVGQAAPVEPTTFCCLPSGT